MWMSAGWTLRCVGLIGGVALVLGGCGGGASGALTTDEVRHSASHCPLDLAAAAKSAGVKAGGAVTGRSVEDPSPVVARVDGAVAECALPLSGGGRLSVTLVAADKGSPVPVLLPLIQERTGISSADLGRVVVSAGKAKPGSLVDLPGTLPVALVILPGGGKTRAAASLAGSDGADRAQAEAVAKALAEGLS
jgi:hypothetical protein